MMDALERQIDDVLQRIDTYGASAELLDEYETLLNEQSTRSLAA